MNWFERRYGKREALVSEVGVQATEEDAWPEDSRRVDSEKQLDYQEHETKNLYVGEARSWWALMTRRGSTSGQASTIRKVLMVTTKSLLEARAGATTRKRRERSGRAGRGSKGSKGNRTVWKWTIRTRTPTGVSRPPNDDYRAGPSGRKRARRKRTERMWTEEAS